MFGGLVTDPLPFPGAIDVSVLTHQNGGGITDFRNVIPNAAGIDPAAVDELERRQACTLLKES